MAPVKTFMMALCCGVVLLGAVTAHAGIMLNGLGWNGLNMNGVSINGISWNGFVNNGMTLNGISVNGITLNGLAAGEGDPVEGPRDGLPFSVITQKALGKAHP
jgi:hypothetical protein